MSWAARRNRTADPTNASGQEIHSSKKDTGNAARTVTITGGRDVGECDCGASHLTGSTSIPMSTRDSSISLRNPSLVGFGGVKAETKVEVTIEQA